MFAVVQTGGKQYKVAVGDRLKVEKLPDAEGAAVQLPRVLMIGDGERVIAGAELADAAVAAKILAHGRGEKIRVFKMKRRKNYRRTQGHRQSFTEIEIVDIQSAQKPAAKKPAVKPAAKKPAAKKPAAKTPAAKPAE